jgi:uncharacterized protein (UPF0332 family)
VNNSEVDDLIEKAWQSLEAAELLLKDSFIDFSASRAYYAMFYSTEALLLDQNRSFSKPKAVISAFGKDFIKSGIFLSFIAISSMPLTSGMQVTMGRCTLFPGKSQSNY